MINGEKDRIFLNIKRGKTEKKIYKNREQKTIGKRKKHDKNREKDKKKKTA